MNSAGQLHPVPTANGPIMVPYLIHRSARAKRISLSLDPLNRAKLTLPQRASLKAGMAFLEQCGDWLQERLLSAPKPQDLLQYLSKHPRLSIDGVPWQVEFSYTQGAAYCVKFRNKHQVNLYYNPRRTNLPMIAEALKTLAKKTLPARLQQLCEKKGIDAPSKITVRSQTHRWGSCSYNQGISLNWRLILLAPKLQDYVILHELAHLIEKNHANSFWRLLQRYDDLALEHDRMLHEVGAQVINLLSGRDD